MYLLSIESPVSLSLSLSLSIHSSTGGRFACSGENPLKTNRLQSQSVHGIAYGRSQGSHHRPLTGRSITLTLDSVRIQLSGVV